MPEADPWAVLGLAPGSPWAEVRAAHRRLAKALHPDVDGGDTRRMAELNLAFAQLAQLAQLAAAARTEPDEQGPEPEVAIAHPDPGDPASFTIEQLPVDAFESLLIVTSFLGDPWVIDEPYQLTARLDPPLACRCLLELVPDAGGSTVTVHLEPRRGFGLAPSPEAVRDALVAELQALGTP